MIAGLTGIIKDISGQEVEINVHDVVYLLHCTSECISGLTINKPATITIHTDVQETSIRLFGFGDRLESQVFKLLIGVNGIGAKSAVEILSRVPKLELLKLLSLGDANGLKAIKGVGAKTADRLILELKDKVSQFIDASRLQIKSGVKNVQLEEATLALQALGFSLKVATEALSKIGIENLPKDSGEIVRRALAQI